MQQHFDKARAQLLRSSHIIVTWGTAVAWKSRETGAIVNNCHKIPASQFEQVLLEPEEILETWKDCISKVKSIRPDIHWIFTISPVRHLRHGAVLNQRSKSHLITAMHQLTEQLSDVYYFSVYEYFMDELRDYRYYGKDMIHPSELAIELVWEKFSRYCLQQNDPQRELAEKIYQRLNHRPRNPQSQAHANFLLKTRQMIDKLVSNKYTERLSKEIELLDEELRIL